MTGAVQAVKDAWDPACFVTTCRKGKCRVSLKDAPEPNVVVDFDAPRSPLGPQAGRCDYLFVADGDRDHAVWVAPMELSTAAKRPGKVVKQLQAGADIAADSIDSGIAVTFRPIFVGPVTSGFREDFRKSARKIRFRGRSVQVRNIQCGERLEKALRQPE